MCIYCKFVDKKSGPLVMVEHKTAILGAYTCDLNSLPTACYLNEDNMEKRVN